MVFWVGLLDWVLDSLMGEWWDWGNENQELRINDGDFIKSQTWEPTIDFSHRLNRSQKHHAHIHMYIKHGEWKLVGRAFLLHWVKYSFYSISFKGQNMLSSAALHQMCALNCRTCYLVDLHRQIPRKMAAGDWLL